MEYLFTTLIWDLFFMQLSQHNVFFCYLCVYLFSTDAVMTMKMIIYEKIFNYDNNVTTIINFNKRKV